MKRLISLITSLAAVVSIAALVATGASGASGAASLPVLKVAVSGVKNISVSGSTVSGAVTITSTFGGKLPRGTHGAGYGLVRLNPGASFQQAFKAVQSQHGDINALDPYGALVVDADAPSTVEASLAPGNYVALNLSGNGSPGAAQFTVTQSSSPAALPGARTTQAAIEFGFRGPTVLHDGTMVRAENRGYLVHMITLIGVRNKRTGRAIIVLLRAGKDHAAQKLASHNVADLLGPASTGAVQQQVLHAKPGYYVEACFMDTQDGREHTQLGMLRLVRVVK